MSVQTTETLFSFMNMMRSKQFRMGDNNYKSPLTSWSDRESSSSSKRRRREDKGYSSSKRRRGGGNSSRGVRKTTSRKQYDNEDAELGELDDENDFTGEEIEVFWGRPHNRWFKAYVKDYNKSKNGFSTLIYADSSEEIAKLFPGGTGKAVGDGGKLENMKWRLAKSSQNLSQAEEGEYKNMIKKALRSIGKSTRSTQGTFTQIVREMQRLFPRKLKGGKYREWRRMVREILFSDFDFVRDKRATSNVRHVFKLKGR